ncbi:hypothetical protein [Streptomyces sp. AF1A]|jgi:hypothetical protein
MRRADDFAPAAHPGSLAGDYVETEAHRGFVLDGTDGDSQEDGW